MESSAGSDVFAIVALLSVCVSVLLILRYFLPIRTTPAYLLTPIFFALALPISVILLVPIDLASSLRTDSKSSKGIWLPKGVLLVAWRIAYWLTFSLTWFILPLLAEYVDSGFRTTRSRLIYSLRSNGRYQLTIMASGAIGLLYVFYQNGFEKTSVKALVMALAYCWGLILAIYLMGHGLVALPRRLYRNSSISGRLRRLQNRAPGVHDRLMEGVNQLEELDAQISLLRQRKHAVSPEHQEWIEELSLTTSLPESRVYIVPRMPAAKLPAVITDRYLAELSRKLNRTRHKRARFADAWDRLVQDAADYQAIIDASVSKRLEFRKASENASLLERSKILTPYTRYLLHVHVFPALRIVLAAIFSLASACIVWSELIKLVAPNISIISLTVVTRRRTGGSEVGFAGQVSAAVWILYMCTAALASFDDVKLWGNRALVRRNTYGESAAWYSGQVAKLTVPLTYNFVTFLPQDVYRETTFYHFLGQLVNLTLLGKSFDYFFPALILVPVCATLFNLYGRVKTVFGYGVIEAVDGESITEYGTAEWRDGRDLIERELNGASRLGLVVDHHRANLPRAPQSQSLFDTGGPSSHLFPTASDTTASGSSKQQPGKSGVEEQRARPFIAAQAITDEDENFLQGFAHRIRNTIDNTRTPDWLSDFGKRPKWMGGVASNNESDGRAESRRGMGRWFGGIPANGRIRL